MSMSFDNWNPQKEAFYNNDFNSYDRGPGKYLGSTNKNENSVQLHVSNLPPHITEDGLRALFLKTGHVNNIWKHRDHCYAFVRMRSLRDAEAAIRKLNDFKIDKYKISVRVAKNDKEKAILMQQKKEEEAFCKKIHIDDNEEEDWNNDNYATFTCADLQPQNLYQNTGDSKYAPLKKNAPLEDIIQTVHNSDTSKNGKTLFDHLEQSRQKESRQRESKFKPSGDGSKKRLKPCRKCGRLGTKRCSQCKSPYCSIECQQKDWIENHHIECINIYLENASLEELANRFDINLDTESLLDSNSTKPLKCEEISADGDQNPSSFKDAQFNKNQKQLKNGKMEKIPPAKKFNSSKQISQRNSSSSQSSQSDVSPRKDIKSQDKRMPIKSKKLPPKRQESSPDNVDKCHKPDFKKKQKSLPKSSFQSKPDYKKPSVPENQMKITSKIQLPLSEFCQVLVTNVANCKDIHVQPIEEANVRMTTYLITELAKVYGDSSKKIPCISSPEVGEIYACCFSADNLWYRAQIISINGSDITVKYIDYGNIEITTCDMMRNLIPELKEIPQQAAWCALDVGYLKSYEEFNVCIKKEIKYDLPYRLKVIKTGEPYLIELYDKDGDVRKKLSKQVLSKSETEDFSESNSSDDLQQIRIPSVKMVNEIKSKSDYLKVGQKYSILPYHVNSPDDFMVQVVILDKEFHEFNSKLQLCATSCPPISQKFVQSQLVLVEKPHGRWCRAEVLQISGSQLTVRLIDYGSIETISIKNVRSVPPLCLDQPVLTVHSKLAEIMPRDKQGWSSKLCSIFKETLEAMNASVRVKEQHILGEYIGPGANERCLWKLIDLCTNTSIANLLVLDGHAILTNTESSPDEEKSSQLSKTMISDIPKIALAVGSVHNGIAIDFQLDTFFINLIQSNQKEFQTNFNGFLDAAGYLGPNYIPCENEIVAAKFSVDNSWYRGQILKVHDDSTSTVFFIDYGNSERLASSQLQPLPKHFVSYHKQAIHCKLHNANISKDGLLQFAKLVLNNECRYKIISQSNEIYDMVVYSNNDECLNDLFKEEIANGYVSETESLKSNSQAGNSLPTLSPESPPESSLNYQISPLSSEGSTALSLAIQRPAFQSTPIPEEGLSSESGQCNQIVLAEQKLSTLSLESQTDSDFVSSASSVKVKYYTKNMNFLPLEENTCYKLHCTTVTDADNFYCQLLDDTAILPYIELMGELAKLCNESSKESSFLPEKGQLVAAKYLDDWYRANVVDILEEKVEVFFIDYGNVSLVAKDQLRELSLEMFVEFPILAIQCCLTGISKQKHMKEIVKFQDETINVKVVGKIGNTYEIIFEEDSKEQLDDNKEVSSTPPPPPPPSCKSEEDAEKERIQRQIEELQQKLASFK